MDTTKRLICCFSLLAGLVACDGMRRIDLEGTNWQLVNLIVLGGFEFAPDDPGDYILNFRSENRLTGSSDCNTLTGSWQQDDMNLSFQDLTTSTNLCPPGSLHNYLMLYLRDVVANDFRDGKLVLTTTTEGVELQFESRDQTR